MAGQQRGCILVILPTKVMVPHSNWQLVIILNYFKKNPPNQHSQLLYDACIVNVLGLPRLHLAYICFLLHQ